MNKGGKYQQIWTRSTQQWIGWLSTCRSQFQDAKTLRVKPLNTQSTIACTSRRIFADQVYFELMLKWMVVENLADLGYLAEQLIQSEPKQIQGHPQVHNSPTFVPYRGIICLCTMKSAFSYLCCCCNLGTHWWICCCKDIWFSPKWRVHIICRKYYGLISLHLGACLRNIVSNLIIHAFTVFWLSLLGFDRLITAVSFELRTWNLGSDPRVITLVWEPESCQPVNHQKFIILS